MYDCVGTNWDFIPLQWLYVISKCALPYLTVNVSGAFTDLFVHFHATLSGTFSHAKSVCSLKTNRSFFSFLRNIAESQMVFTSSFFICTLTNASFYWIVPVWFLWGTWLQLQGAFACYISILSYPGRSYRFLDSMLSQLSGLTFWNFLWNKVWKKLWLKLCHS